MRWALYTLSLILVAFVAALVAYWTPPVIGKTAEPAGAANVLEHVAVVDVDRLVQASADAQKLYQIDQEIAYISAQIESVGPNPEEIVKTARGKLETAKKKYEDQFNSDMARVKVDLESKKAAVEGTLKAEADSISAQLRGYQEELKTKAGAGPITVNPEPDTRRKLEEQLRLAQEPLRLAAQSKLAARQLELQQALQSTMSEAKKTVERRLAEQMDAVLRADQGEKLQLQLDIQTASDEDQRKKLQDRLQIIHDREEAKREELRKNLYDEYEAARKKTTTRMQADLGRYQAGLQAEVQQKTRVQQARIAGRFGYGGGVSPTVVKSLQQAMDIKQRELKARFESRKNALVGELKAVSDQAQVRLKHEQTEIVGRLKAEQQRIYADIVKAQGKISKEEQSRRDHLKAQLDELKGQRDRVYDAIVAQIRDNVKKLADEQKVPLVVGGYRVNIRCQDLTELALKQAAGASGAADAGSR